MNRLDSTSSRLARQNLLELLSAAIAAVVPQTGVRERLLMVETNEKEVSIVAIGKAAGVMLQGALQALGDKVADALAITSPPYAASVPASVTCLPGNHPVPDASSLAAGDGLLEFLRAQPRERKLVFLISGGASAMVEHLEVDVSPDTLERATRWMLANALGIRDMNLVRKSLSSIKGGKLLRYFENDALVLLVSDVPGDNPSDIGSGLLSPDAAIADLRKLDLPDWLAEAVGTPEPQQGRDNVTVEILASNDIAKEGAAQSAREKGLTVTVHPGCIGGETGLVAREITNYLTNDAPAGIHVWGGETSVNLPENPGMGGRNQQLALQVAERIAGNDNICFLSAGTDGIDGFSEDAGAIVDGGTIQRGREEGFDPAESLVNADSNPFLAASGDLINLGATGTNVMDIMIAWKRET